MNVNEMIEAVLGGESPREILERSRRSKGTWTKAGTFIADEPKRKKKPRKSSVKQQKEKWNSMSTGERERLLLFIYRNVIGTAPSDDAWLVPAVQSWAKMKWTSFYKDIKDEDAATASAVLRHLAEE